MNTTTFINAAPATADELYAIADRLAPHCRIETAAEYAANVRKRLRAFMGGGALALGFEVLAQRQARLIGA